MKKAPVLLFALPYVAVFLGMLCNQAVVHINGGHMPVLFPGHACMLEALKDDPVHVCMVANHHLKFLGDIVLGSQRVTSIGDQLMEFGTDIRIPSLIMSVVLVIRDIFVK